MAEQAEPVATLHVARVIIDGKDPVEFTAATVQALHAALAAWCRDYWKDRRRYATDAFPATPPADDTEAISIYFHEAGGESLETAIVDLEPPPDTSGLSDDELAEACSGLDTLTLTILEQQATIARALLGRIKTRQAPGQHEPLDAAEQRQVKQLLTAITLAEAAHHAAQDGALEQAQATIAAEASEDADAADANGQEIGERVVGELPRQFDRRVRWTREQLERIIALNEESPVPLAPDQRALREAVSVNARALIDARRQPNAECDPDGVIAQVAYLMPVEVIVDLDQRRITRVVGIDEGIELDPAEGAREYSTLNPLPLECAASAIAIAEKAAVWPALSIGF